MHLIDKLNLKINYLVKVLRKKYYLISNKLLFRNVMK